MLPWVRWPSPYEPYSCRESFDLRDAVPAVKTQVASPAPISQIGTLGSVLRDLYPAS